LYRKPSFVLTRLNPYLLSGGVLALLLSVLGGCSQYSSSPGSVAFHNLTAKYNAYYIARFETELAERAMRKAYQDNYNQILPVLIPLDSTLGITVRPQLENAIKKASIVAERHQNSKWLDDSYTLIGKDRLYLGQYDDGVEALRYVFTNGRDEDDKNTALVWLMRAYTQKKDYTNALDVAEYLRQQPLTKETTRDFYLAKAAVHQRQGEFLTAAAILEQAFPLLKRGPEKARLHYVAGQLYDRIGQYALAADHYRDVGKNRPTYDLSFYASMNSLQNRVLLDPRVDLTDVGFDKMLRDRKNNDLRDRIYYTMGLLAERRGRYPEAIGYLQKSVQVARANPEQIPYTYLELARINYDRLENYETAQSYYDSALVTLPQGAEQYKIISDRKKALDEFVTQLTIVRTEDSLQTLAQMNPAALERKLDVIIEAEEEAKQQLLLKAQEALAASNRPLANNSTPFLSGNERRWELYDPLMVNQGRVEFRRMWGNRTLEDNWRRANKENASFTAGVQGPDLKAGVAPPPNELGLQPETTLTKGSEAWVARREELLKNVPTNELALASSAKRKEDALYRLGKIYRFDLKESEKAVTTFTRLLNEFPKTAYREEIYYLIYLSLDESNKNRLLWKEKLLAEFPSSSYARLLNQAPIAGNNPGTSTTGSSTKTYDGIYNLYTTGNYSEALAQVENALAVYRENALVDKFALLRIFLVGKVRGRDAYLQAINEFIRLYPDSALLPRVQEMLEVTGRASIRR
jgi:tetratricopeptide (TPR) repeat protein